MKTFCGFAVTKSREKQEILKRKHLEQTPKMETADRKNAVINSCIKLMYLPDTFFKCGLCQEQS